MKFTRSVNITKDTLSYVHSDLWGPAQHEIICGAGILSHSSTIVLGKFGCTS